MSNSESNRRLNHAALRVKPRFWFREAERLASAALILAVLREKNAAAISQGKGPLRTRLNKVDAYLMGSALEAILKGDRAREQVEALNLAHLDAIDSVLTVISKNAHDLRAIANERGFHLEDFEEVLLDDVTQVIKWRARYSLPKKLESFEEPDINAARWKQLCAIVQRASNSFGAGIELHVLLEQSLADLGIAD